MALIVGGEKYIAARENPLVLTGSGGEGGSTAGGGPVFWAGGTTSGLKDERAE